MPGKELSIMVESEDLEATYGPSAPYSEHKRGDHITFTTAEGLRSSGTIVWVQAAFQDIPMKYVIAPDDGQFLDFALPSDVITVTQANQEPILHKCPYCPGSHYDVEACPQRPFKTGC